MVCQQSNLGGHSFRSSSSIETTSLLQGIIITHALPAVPASASASAPGAGGLFGAACALVTTIMKTTAGVGTASRVCSGRVNVS